MFDNRTLDVYVEGEMADPKREIDELRGELAKADEELVAALDRRARASRRIGELRRDVPGSLALDASRLPAPPRTGSDMPVESLESIFREVRAASRGLELPAKIAYVGVEGGVPHAIARGHFGASASYVATDSASLALDEVTRHRVEFAVLPYETHTDGPVQATIASLVSTELRIIEVVEASPTLHLLNKTGNLADIEKIYVTPSDRVACEKGLLAVPGPSRVLDVKSPVIACQLASEDHGAGAVASEFMAPAYGLEVARRDVMDHTERARYAIVGSRPSSRTGENLTALVFSVRDAPGALLDILKSFAERGVNLTKIHSRPVETEGWAYLFFVELAGHATDRALVTAFEELRRLTKFFKVLGSYPARDSAH